MTPGVGSNIGIDTSGFDYIEGSGFVMEGLEDKGLDAKSYIQSVLRRHEGKILPLSLVGERSPSICSGKFCVYVST